jgi:hypothetical protein
MRLFRSAAAACLAAVCLACVSQLEPPDLCRLFTWDEGGVI